MITLKLNGYTAQDTYTLYYALLAALDALNCAGGIEQRNCGSCKNMTVCADLARACMWLEKSGKF